MRFLFAAAFLLLVVPAEARCLATPNVVKMFVADWCQICSALQTELHRRDIDFVTCDIEEDADCAHEFYALGHEGVPVTYVCTTSFTGYKPDAIQSALRRHYSETDPADW